MEYYFYIIVGASATGKGALMDQLIKEKKWVKATKYSTRSYRGENDDIAKIGNERLFDLEKRESELKSQIENPLNQYDESLKWELFDIQNSIREERLNIINEYCGEGSGYVYFLNGNFYGIQTSGIFEKLKENNVVVVCSDFNIIAKLKKDKTLSPYVRVIYIASTIDERELLRRYKSRETITFDGIQEESILNIENISSTLASAGRLKYYSKMEEIIPLLNEQWNEVLPYFETIKTRATNIRLLYNRYIDHIDIIDCPILNFYDLEYMFTQQRNYINFGYKKTKKSSPPIFMVCAAPSAGKATLMSIVGGLGQVNNNIVITKKYAKRAKRPTDGRDGMVAIGKEGNFLDYIKDPKDVWSWSFHGGKTEYAVDIAEIKNNIAKGKAQIFISNIGQIERARELFPQNIVVLYLHATHESATKKHIKEKRKSEIILSIQKKYGESIKEASNIFEQNIQYTKELDDLVEKDIQEIKEIHYSYCENNYLIDHVLLNTGTNNDLIEQMINLINAYTM